MASNRRKRTASELVEAVREALVPLPGKPFPMGSIGERGVLALTELAERLKEAERSYETAERAAVMWMERAEAAESLNAELVEALREIESLGETSRNYEATRLYKIARDTLEARSGVH